MNFTTLIQNALEHDISIQNNKRFYGMTTDSFSIGKEEEEFIFHTLSPHLTPSASRAIPCVPIPFS